MIEMHLLFNALSIQKKRVRFNIIPAISSIFLSQDKKQMTWNLKVHEAS
jgi:hypothetical protein